MAATMSSASSAWFAVFIMEGAQLVWIFQIIHHLRARRLFSRDVRWWAGPSMQNMLNKYWSDFCAPLLIKNWFVFLVSMTIHLRSLKRAFANFFFANRVKENLNDGYCLYPFLYRWSYGAHTIINARTASSQPERYYDREQQEQHRQEWYGSLYTLQCESLIPWHG